MKIGVRSLAACCPLVQVWGVGGCKCGVEEGECITDSSTAQEQQSTKLLRTVQQYCAQQIIHRALWRASHWTSNLYVTVTQSTVAFSTVVTLTVHGLTGGVGLL